jgi:hypothetical protein
MHKWTPREVIAQVLEVDPKADKTSTIAIGREEEQGQPSKNMKMLGENRRFTLKWANRSHNGLADVDHRQIDRGCDDQSYGGWLKSPYFRTDQALGGAGKISFLQ